MEKSSTEKFRTTGRQDVPLIVILRSSADIAVLKKLLLFSVGMFVLPIGTFFLLQKILPKGNVVIPVAGSVIAVHVVIGIYVWMAMNEGADTDKDSAPLKED